jgi:hypothetical protein
MWYRFEKGNDVGIPRIKNYQICWYDMERGGSCFDEDFCSPDEIDRVIPFVETVEDEGSFDRSRVFVHFDDGDEYELKLIKVDKKQKNGYFYGKETRKPMIWSRLRRLFKSMKFRFRGV